jgi:hypothetical protein
MNIKQNIFRLGSIYKKLSRPINAINHPPPHTHTHNMQNGVGVPSDSSTILSVPRVSKGCATLRYSIQQTFNRLPINSHEYKTTRNSIISAHFNCVNNNTSMASAQNCEVTAKLRLQAATWRPRKIFCVTTVTTASL